MLVPCVLGKSYGFSSGSFSFSILDLANATSHNTNTLANIRETTLKKIESDNRTLIIDGKQYELEHRIKDFRIIENLAIVIYDFDENAPRHRQFQNCKAFDKNGNLMWTAEHPTNMTADSYVEFMKGRGNKLWNFGCFICELDFKNGKLKNAVFTK